MNVDLDQMCKFQNVNAGKVSFNKPFDWAIANKKSIELFVNVVDTAARINQNSKMRQTSKNISVALSEYRMAMNLPKARYVCFERFTFRHVEGITFQRFCKKSPAIVMIVMAQKCNYSIFIGL